MLQGWDIKVDGKGYFFESYGVGKTEDLRLLYGRVGKPVVVEAERSEFPQHSELGFREIPVKYYQPPLKEGEERVELTLMVKNGAKITGREIKGLVYEIYRSIYGVEPYPEVIRSLEELDDNREYDLTKSYPPPLR